MKKCVLCLKKEATFQIKHNGLVYRVCGDCFRKLLKQAKKRNLSH